MRTLQVICLMVVVCFCPTSAGFSSTIQDSISYPSKPPETTIKEMVDAGKGLAKETTELGKAMVNGVKEDGGVVATIRKHKKFYGGIFVFGLLTLIWLKTRDK
jgi:hypothetical protein